GPPTNLDVRPFTVEAHAMLATMMMRSPIGALCLCAERDQLVGMYLPNGPTPPGEQRRTDVLVRTAAQLTEYFAGQRRDFDLPLAPRGTEFQREVWAALAEIPFGVTCSYGELARAIGRPAPSP